MDRGETDLSALLAGLAPELLEGEFVFCTFEGARYGDHAALEPFAAVTEREGLTLVVPRERADAHGLSYTSVWRGITLTVHSSLEAVGLTAAVSRALAERGISANMIAGYYHDHVFVQTGQAEEAIEVLSRLESY